MDKTRFYWWLLNFWMIAVGAACIWVFFTYQDSLTYWHEREDYFGFKYLMLALPVLSVIVGYVRIPFRQMREVDGGLPGVNGLGQIYLDAWKTLWGSKRLILVFGVLAMILVLAYASYPLVAGLEGSVFWQPSVRYLTDFGSFDSRTFVPVLGASQNHVAGWMLPSVTSDAFLPAAEFLFSIAVLAAILRLRRRLREVPEDAQYSAGRAFVRRIMAPLGVCILVVTPGLVPIFSDRLYELLPYNLVGAIVPVSIHVIYLLAIQVSMCGFVVAGVIGCVGRLRSGRSVFPGDFTEEAIRFFRPVAGAFLILALARILLETPFLWFRYRSLIIVPDYSGLQSSLLGSPQHPMEPVMKMLYLRLIPFAALPFMFAPFAAVKHGLTAWRGVIQGLRDWGRNAWDCLSMIAVGFSLMVGPLVGAQFLPLLAPHSDWPQALLHLCNPLLWVICSAVTMIAVWEFYQRIDTKDRDRTAVPYVPASKEETDEAEIQRRQNHV